MSEYTTDNTDDYVVVPSKAQARRARHEPDCAVRPELVRTVREIAKIIGRSERGTQGLLERNPGAIPGVFKEGGRWVMDVGVWCRKTRERAEKPQ
jgi:hypothetical protein